MKLVRLVAAALALAALGGCAHHHHHGGPPAGGAARTVTVPTSADGEPARESKKLLQEPGLTAVAITLSRGTVLPEHHSPAQVTIQALVGRGSVVMRGGERLPVGPGQVVFVPAFAPHSVEPEAGGDLVLLVTHAGNPEERHP